MRKNWNEAQRNRSTYILKSNVARCRRPNYKVGTAFGTFRDLDTSVSQRGGYERLDEILLSSSWLLR